MVRLPFGGFFDGILLHQVLQWHHLLSAVESEAVRDLRVQVLADGLFHVVKYVVAAVGLWLLWAARREIAAPHLAASCSQGYLSVSEPGMWPMLYLPIG